MNITINAVKVKDFLAVLGVLQAILAPFAASHWSGKAETVAAQRDAQIAVIAETYRQEWLKAVRECNE